MMKMGEKEILADSEKYAKKAGFILNPDKKHVAMIVKGLAQNEKEFGARYCPCRARTGNLKEDKKIICPCIYHKDEIKRDGHCLCRLFFRKGF